MRGLIKKNDIIIIVLFILLLLFAGIFALTQEAPDDETVQDGTESDHLTDEISTESDETEALPVWVPPVPARWYRSNQGGVALEEIPSRLAALRNKYALVIDYLPPYEVEPYLIPYYKDDYLIEIRILYVDKEVDRIQWIFRDENGTTRLNAVKLLGPETLPLDEEPASVITANDEDENKNEAEAETAEDIAAETLEENEDNEENDGMIAEGETLEEIKETMEFPFLFIEIFNENAQITSDRQYLDDGLEYLVNYNYNMGHLVNVETFKDKYLIHTDTYRYNRSYSLRSVERVFYGDLPAQPVRENFAARILDAAMDMNFISEKPQLVSEFLGSYSAEENFRLLTDLDSRGRVLSQKMTDDEDEIIWIIENTWVGDRISATKRTEDGNIKMIEY